MRKHPNPSSTPSDSITYANEPNTTYNDHFIYANCRGLNALTWERALNWIKHPRTLSHPTLQGPSATVKLVVLSEHWFTSFFQDVKAHPYILGYSTEPDYNVRLSTHHPGGLLIVCHPSLHHLFRITHRTYHTLSIKCFGSTTLTFAYFPPSIDYQLLRQECEAMPQTSLVIGDTNTRYGRLTGDTRLSTPTTLGCIDSMCRRLSLSLILPSTGGNRCFTDHVFSSRPQTEWHYIRDVNFDSDHGIMLVPLNIDDGPLSGPTSALVTRVTRIGTCWWII